MTGVPRSALVASLMVLSVALQAQAPGPPSIAALLDQAGDYITAYESKFSAVVSEEHYRQTLDRRVSSTVRRELKSDVLVVNSGVGGWMGFRDVYEVDGRVVRDHDQRLTKLFVNPASDTMTHARQIADEGSRYNLGSISRNINTPTMALTYLRRENQARSTFELSGTSKIEGVQTIALKFREVNRPTIVRSGEEDSPASGQFWIDPSTGRVVRSQLKLTPAKLSATITVTYGATPKLDLWVPLSMSESYRAVSGENIEGSATYSNFRRFNVDVTSVPKGRGYPPHRTDDKN